MVEPTLGAMLPTNWTPLYIEWKPVGSQNVYELRLHVDNQTNDLVVYSTKTSYTLDASVWSALSTHSGGHDVTLTVRGGVVSGSTLVVPPALGSSGAIHIAPVAAPGNIVYWTTSNGSSLKGFQIGASTVGTIVTPAKMADGTQCVGCHTSSPDGALSFLSRAGSSGGPFDVDARLVDGTASKTDPMAVSANAFTNLARTDQTLPIMSAAHYSTTDAIVITTLDHPDTSNKTELVWTDLHASTGGTGIIARTGDSRAAASPAWSHDGTKIAYTSSISVGDGRTNSAETDIFMVPYNNHAGGAATGLPGASDASVHEYYPVFSADDTLIAYDESPSSANTYNEPTAEVHVILATGGSTIRLAANAPPSWSGMSSPGVTNSWPRWASEVQVAGNLRYHWLVFSSTRRRVTTADHPEALSQLYVSAVVVDTSTGKVTDYPAVYVRSQPANEVNHTPAWDVFKLPPTL